MNKKIKSIPFYLKKQEGLTILECILAAFLITVGLVGIFSLISQTISSYTFSSQKLIAAYLAQEGFELVRNIRDTNWLEGGDWDEGFTGCLNGCEADYTCTTVYDPSPGNPSSNCLSPYGSGNFLRIDASNLYNYTFGTPTKFTRKITITSPATADCPEVDCRSVKVEIFWEEKGVSHSFVNQGYLYNWHR